MTEAIDSARSMAGDILLHPEFGMMFYASVFTELEIRADAPMENNPCPHPSCVKLYRKSGKTPCLLFCPDETGRINRSRRYLLFTGKQKCFQEQVAGTPENCRSNAAYADSKSDQEQAYRAVVKTVQIEPVV